MKRMISVPVVIWLLLGTLLIFQGGNGSTPPEREEGGVLYVGPSGSTYREVQHAIDNSSDGDTIYVAPGFYDMGMTVSTRGISLVGNITEGDVVVRQDADAIVFVLADWVNISGFIFTDIRDHLGIMSISNADHVSIDSVKLICAGKGEGLYMRESNNVRLSNIDIRSNNYAAARIRISNNVEFEDFNLSCNRSLAGCLELDGVDGLLMRSGVIELRGRGTSIYDLAGGDLILYDVESRHTEKFIMMETGNISMYNMNITPGDIYMDFPDPLHTVSSYKLRDIVVTGELADGEIAPLEGVDLRLTTDGVHVYSTTHFGGNASVTESDGKFPNRLPFLSWRLRGGETGYTNGTNDIEVVYLGDRLSSIELLSVDANTTEDIEIQFTDIFDQVRSISGRVTYLDGPMTGENATNATVRVFDDNMTEVANATVNETGLYEIGELAIGVNYTVMAIPESEVEDQGEASGYLRSEVRINLTEDASWDPGLQYYEFSTPPSEGPIFGYIRYQEGPRDGEFSEGAEVRLFNATGENLGTTTTDVNGHYVFEGIPFGEGYEVRATPPLDELGVNLEITGYLVWDGSAFAHNGSTRINGSLKYYEHTENPVFHPSVMILDEEGRPVEGVQVEATILGATYRSTTDAAGKAVFESLDMAQFPSNATFRASKEGFDDITWRQGEIIPAIKESEDASYKWLIALLVAIVLIVVAAAAYLIFVRKGPEEALEE
ncbi:MAG: hypothetical protein ACMUHY_07050 [Thermoplasmatota archaeon]